jgi:hypothetical protein
VAFRCCSCFVLVGRDDEEPVNPSIASYGFLKPGPATLWSQRLLSVPFAGIRESTKTSAEARKASSPVS